MNKYRNKKGFTLVELLIVVAIVAILAAIGIPSYAAQAQKTRRADAKNTLIQVAQSLEKCMSLYGVYNNANCAGGTLGTGDTVDSDEEHYTITITIPAAGNTFSLAAAPQTTGGQTGDSHCASITYDNTGDKSGTHDDCW